MYDLEQIVTKPTQITAKSKTLIDHFITNHAKKVTHIDLLPCPLISNHSAPYIYVNVRVNRFVPRHKFITEERPLAESAFIDEHNIRCGWRRRKTRNILNTLLFNCIEARATKAYKDHPSSSTMVERRSD